MRVPAVWVAFGLLLGIFSGCATPAPDDEDSEPSPASTPAMEFGEPVKVLRLRNNQAETFVDASPDGTTILTCLHGEFKEPSPMFVSIDGGATFRELTATPSAGVGGDCEVTYGADGTWYFLHSTVAGATLASTRDQGRSWDVNPASAIPISSLADRPWIEAAGTGLFMSYMPLYLTPGYIAFTKSTDRGKTWSVPVRVNDPDAEHTNSMNGHLTISPDNKTVRIPIIEFMAGQLVGNVYALRFSLATSRDAGATWKEERIPGPVEAVLYWSNVAYAGPNTLYWPLVVRNGTGYDHAVLYSLDDGKTWSKPWVVAAGLASTQPAWIDGRADGSASMAWAARDPKDPPENGTSLFVARFDANHPEAGVTIVKAGKAARPEFMALVHDETGRAHVAYLFERTLHYVGEKAKA